MSRVIRTHSVATFIATLSPSTLRWCKLIIGPTRGWCNRSHSLVELRRANRLVPWRPCEAHPSQAAWAHSPLDRLETALETALETEPATDMWEDPDGAPTLSSNANS